MIDFIYIDAKACLPTQSSKINIGRTIDLLKQHGWLHTFRSTLLTIGDRTYADFRRYIEDQDVRAIIHVVIYLVSPVLNPNFVACFLCLYVHILH